MNNYNNYDYQSYIPYSDMRVDMNKPIIDEQNNNPLDNVIPNLSKIIDPNIMDTAINNTDLATPYISYVRGNLFNDLYSGYKNYQPMPFRPRNEREDLLLSINQLTFAARELNLYLDTHPNAINMLDLFNKYRELADQAINEFESKYGPFVINSDYMKGVPFNWVVDPWPWELGGRE